MNEGKLKQALARLQDEDWKRLEQEDGPVHVFSETFERSMEEILREEKQKSRRRRISRMRSAAAVLALCVLAGFGIFFAGRRLLAPDGGSAESVSGADGTAAASAGENGTKIQMEAAGDGWDSEIRLLIGQTSGDAAEYRFTVENDTDSQLYLLGSWKILDLGDLKLRKNRKLFTKLLAEPKQIVEKAVNAGREGVVLPSGLADTEDTWILAGESEDFSVGLSGNGMTRKGLYLLVTSWYTEGQTQPGEDASEGTLAVFVLIS